MNDSLNKSLIRRHEGQRKQVYRDSRGLLTVGIGFNLQANASRALCTQAGVDYDALCAARITLTDAQVEAIFERQYEYTVSGAELTFPDLKAMPDFAAAVIVDMVFNLGLGNFLNFRKFIAAMKAADWATAIVEMYDSAWAKQVPNRCDDDAKLLEKLIPQETLQG